MSQNLLVKDLFVCNEAKKFCTENALSENEILRNYSSLSQFKQIITTCKNCDHKHCTSQIENMTCHLEIDSNRVVYVVYDDCMIVKQTDPGNLEVMDFQGQDIIPKVSQSRIKLWELFDQFNEKYFKGEFTKGIYLYGNCGVGKSFLLYLFAKNLVKKGAKVLFAYYPDLVRRIQNSFATGTTEDIVYKLKTADILMLDDIGREVNTAYIRDAILGPILQYRCDNCLPMFMTSNRDFKLLEKHLSETANLNDEIKANAIMERIKYLMKEFKLEDIDYRNN